MSEPGYDLREVGLSDLELVAADFGGGGRVEEVDGENLGRSAGVCALRRLARRGWRGLTILWEGLGSVSDGCGSLGVGERREEGGEALWWWIFRRWASWWLNFRPAKFRVGNPGPCDWLVGDVHIKKRLLRSLITFTSPRKVIALGM